MSENTNYITTQSLLIKNGSASVGDALIVIFAMLAFMIPWIGGCVLAPTWWQTLLAIPFFPYAWYLFAERIMQVIGLI